MWPYTERTNDRPSTPQGNQCLLLHFLASLGAQEKTNCTSMLWSIDSCQNRVNTDQYHLTVPQAQVTTHRGQIWPISRVNLVNWDCSVECVIRALSGIRTCKKTYICTEGHFILVYVYDLVKRLLPWTMPIKQVSIKCYLPTKEIYLSLMNMGDFLKPWLF